MGCPVGTCRAVVRRPGDKLYRHCFVSVSRLKSIRRGTPATGTDAGPCCGDGPVPGLGREFGRFGTEESATTNMIHAPRWEEELPLQDEEAVSPGAGNRTRAAAR